MITDVHHYVKQAVVSCCTLTGRCLAGPSNPGRCSCSPADRWSPAETGSSLHWAASVTGTDLQVDNQIRFTVLWPHCDNCTVYNKTNEGTKIYSALIFTASCLPVTVEKLFWEDISGKHTTKLLW